MQIERLPGQGLYQKAINVDVAEGAHEDKEKDELSCGETSVQGCGVPRLWRRKKCQAFCSALAPSLLS